MKIDKEQWKWTREPKECAITDDNAPVLQLTTKEKFFFFVVKTEFESKVRFDQCGVVMYLDSENWLKGSIEYENDEFQHLGSVASPALCSLLLFDYE